MNILTFDVEEWFHLLDNNSTRTEKQWNNFEIRIYQNMDRIFKLLDETDSKATFFIIGWVAKRYPDIVKRIAEKYEIGSHTMNHQLVWQQSRDEFKQDVESSILLLEDISGKKVECFRAPGFSIRESESWAFEILHDLGIKYDSSVFPGHHSHGGMSSFREKSPSWIEYSGVKIKEFPIVYQNILGQNVVFSGGGYFRLLPYSLIKYWTKKSDPYLMSYIHPRDLDALQPMIKDLSMFRKFKSYYGLKTSLNKMYLWLNDFKFIDINEANNYIDWEKAKTVHL